MNKELKAFEELRSSLSKNFVISDVANEKLDLIETALKRLETLEEEKQSFDRQLEKKLKALEIIKERVLEIDDFHKIISCKDQIMLTMKEYDLLKEVLL